MDNNENVNPWATFKGDDCIPKRTGDNTIDNRFPNNFRKYSSLVTCNFCNVILLMNQTQQHFKIHHNKKFKKKFSRFKIPFNAVEGYDLICELRQKKLANSNISRNNNTKDLFKLKHKHSDSTFVKQPIKTPIKLIKKTYKENKPLECEDLSSSKITNMSDNLLTMNSEYIHPKNNDENSRAVKKISPESKTETRKMYKRSILTSTNVNNKPPKSADLKLNIRLNSDGLLTSSIKGEVTNCSNIFDRISHFCDNTTNTGGNICDKDNSLQIMAQSRGTIKQSGFDESYGCAIFTDEFNNSILIDQDKDEPDDFDCCESSLSNDSAYFSLPNSGVNSITTTANGKPSNLCDFSVAPPLVTAYQYSHSTNKVSYSASDSQVMSHVKSTPMTMHVTRSLSYNSIVPPKSTVKHRFYVSGHSNQTIINTLKRKCNTISDMNFLLDNENDDTLLDFQTNGILHSLSKESQDPCYLENNKPSSYQSLKHPVNSKSCTNGIKDIADNRFWNCFEENGLKVNILIPKTLKWTQFRTRIKSAIQLKTKQSPKNIVPKQQFLRSTLSTSISENPLLTSYTIDATNVDDAFQSDPLLTSEIVLDYQFTDRNQMSFQQRLLERGVISQRDIVRSQRCLPFNANGNSRKNNKVNPTKPNIIDYNRISANKNYPIRTQVVCRTGYNSITSSTSSFNKSKPTVIHQSTPLMSHDVKVNSIPKHAVTNRKPTWRENTNLSRIQNQVSTFQGQCLSNNNKYINQDSRITIAPSPNRKTSMSAVSRTMDGRSLGTMYQPTSSHLSILHTNNSPFHPILPAQNLFSNDSNRYSHKPMEGQFVQLATNNNVNHRYKKVDNEFINFHQSYDDINPSMVSQSNYQTIYNPQIKYGNHSTTMYNGNFEL